MKPNVLTEIRRTRDGLACATGYDLNRLFDYVREREREAAAHGVKFVSPAPHEKKPPTLCAKIRPNKNKDQMRFFRLQQQ